MTRGQARARRKMPLTDLDVLFEGGRLFCEVVCVLGTWMLATGKPISFGSIMLIVCVAAAAERFVSFGPESERVGALIVTLVKRAGEAWTLAWSARVRNGVEIVNSK